MKANLIIQDLTPSWPDLFFRLNVFPIEVVPLRKRKEDIPLLAEHFLERAAMKLNLPKPRLTQNCLLKLQRYDWPGNIRELQNVIERGVITSRRGALRFDIPQYQTEEVNAPSIPEPEGEFEVIPEEEMRRRERENLSAALKKTNWKIYGSDGAAALLGIIPTALVSRMKKMGLKKPVITL